MAARTPRVVFSNTDFAKLDREDKEGRALFQRVVTLTFADRDVQIETKLRLKYFKAGTGWDLEQLRADVAELEAAAIAAEVARRFGPRQRQCRPSQRLEDVDLVAVGRTHARHRLGGRMFPHVQEAQLPP